MCYNDKNIKANLWFEIGKQLNKTKTVVFFYFKYIITNNSKIYYDVMY